MSLFFLKLDFEFKRIFNLKIQTIIYKLLYKFFLFFMSIFMQPFGIILHLLNFRYVNIFSQRIGHLAIEPDCLFKNVLLGRIPKRKWIFLYDDKIIANKHLFKYWSKYFLVIDNYILRFLVRSISLFGLMKHDIKKYARTYNFPHEIYNVYSLWGNRKPILELTTDDIHWGNEQLSLLGLPINSLYILLHVREGSYSEVDESIQCYRNSDIVNYFQAIEYITSRGGWVVRIGDSNCKKLPIMHKVIDYAHSNIKSDRLDVILCARANFVLGSTSGICLVSTIFGVPVAIANCAPPCGLGLGFNDISIPKKIYDTKLKKLYTYSESLTSSFASYRYASQYHDNNLILIENSEEELYFLAVEMYKRVNEQFYDFSLDNIYKLNYINLANKSFYSYFSSSNIASFYVKNNW